MLYDLLIRTMETILLRDRTSDLTPEKKSYRCYKRYGSFLILIAGILALLVSPTSGTGCTPLLLDLDSTGEMPWNVSGIVPGDSGTSSINLTNSGTIEGSLFIWVNNVTGDQAFGKYLFLDISAPRIISFTPLPATVYDLPQSPEDNLPIIISPLRPGETVTIDHMWEFRETGKPQNEAQGKSLAFDIYYTLRSPSVLFTADVTCGQAPLTVEFTDRSPGEPTTWSWDLGDGCTSTEQNPVHAYCEAGTYTVTLTIPTCSGVDTAIREDYITVYGGTRNGDEIGSVAVPTTSSIQAVTPPPITPDGVGALVRPTSPITQSPSGDDALESPLFKDHRFFMILALILLAAGLTIRLGLADSVKWYPGAKILWAAGVIVAYLGVAYEALIVAGTTGEHFAAAHSIYGIVAILALLPGLTLLFRTRDRKDVEPFSYLDGVLVIGLIGYLLLCVIAFMIG